MSAAPLPAPAFDDPANHLRLFQGDCLDILAALPAAPKLIVVVMDMLAEAVKNERYIFCMTTKQAIKVAKQIILDNREIGELEGILNRNRIAALNRLVRIAERKTKRQKKFA